MLRYLMTLLLLAATAVGLADRPLVAPNYYLSQLPKLLPGVPVTAELTDEDGQNFKDGSRVHLYVFDAPEDAWVSLRLWSDEFDTYLSVYDAYGSLVVANDDGDDHDGYSYVSEADFGAFTPGRYLVVVSGYSQYDLGEYTLVLKSAAQFDAVAAEEIDLPATVTGTLYPDDPPVPGGWTGPGRSFRFTVTEGTAVRIDARSDEMDAYLYLFDGAGNLVAFNDDEDYSEATGYNTDATIFTALKAGTYVVVVSSWDGSGSGAFTLTLAEYVPKE